MKILLVNPRFPKSLWGFQGMYDLTGVRSGQAPLGLLTVAALTPPEIDVALLDENCYPLDYETDADVVAIGCWNVQYRRAREIATEFRKRGKRVVVGGPYASLCPERFEDGHFDVVFNGEVEITWPEFCRDLLAGAPKPLYRQVGNVDIRLSPVPRFDLIKPDDYLYYFAQTTRGCPFQCEFCDIIVTDGRIPRTKPVEQVVAELEAIARLGGHFVSFSDANYIGNHQYAETLTRELVAFGKKHGYPLSFSAEMTINVAEKPQLLELLREANFTGIFCGIESPNMDSLKETKKRQNTAKPLIESIRKIQSHNLMVIAGMIVGFDNDDARIFQAQYDFLQEAGIAFTTCGVLTAIEKTPLHARLLGEGRLLPYDSANVLGHGAADLNFVPKQMSPTELHRGYNWLIRALYSYDAYRARLTTALRHFEVRPDLSKRTAERFDWKLMLTGLKAARHFLLTWSGRRRRFFVGTLRDVIREGASVEKLTAAISYMVAHKHFHEYVTSAHGDPEAVPALSPFSESEPAAEWTPGLFSRERVQMLKEELYPLTNLASWVRPSRRVVAVPEPFLTEKVGQCLRRYLDELGVEVMPVANAALARLRDSADVVVLPILGSVRKGREDLYQAVQQLHERVSVERLPRVVHLALDGDHRAVFDAFAQVGLIFTRRVERLRRAYLKAVEAATAPSAVTAPGA
ncbi:MAG: DUF4070 domain-containing protein [Candidatus Rokubacteria bacterium]|nr:DUF4070 domain-containing protein [Candidatus Rokubacteria bacterium]